MQKEKRKAYWQVLAWGLIVVILVGVWRAMQ
ncbi:hypothetical protein BpOF4_12055 [Alkalihalophilus pseudofirmus OF4]|uniref:Uncharacterized protein n=2 Tax=Alkalihalophilus TaxID=2893060 RepID=D3FW32_ALKPO|nr:hypothetical protein BpOF4_12055 [Alkalihalophilus pseudofirmus OF4]ERN55052.1 hypothetical protein A33I_03690 [Alkalihalophilus marmarensis DSM 21297]